MAPLQEPLQEGDKLAGVKWDVVPYTRGTVLDVGRSLVDVFPHFTGSDGTAGVASESCDAIFCARPACLVPDHTEKVLDWWRCLKPEGYLVTYLAHAGVQRALDACGWNLVTQDRHEPDGLFLQVFQKRADARKTFPHLATPPKRTACVVRYGGFGDMLQASNILPALKKQGYSVTLMTTPGGQDVLRHDPHVSNWFIQDQDQVPNHLLAEFWAHVAKRFDKFVNLCESVEGTLLAMPGRANYAWPFSVRHARMNDNYLEFTAQLAEVPNTCDARFYPTEAEALAAKGRLLEDGLNVVWALAGSSCHKFYPGLDVVMARILLEYPACRIFLVGDQACKLLEQGWENEPRVVRLSGELPIRDTLALAQVVDCVIGCETGVLNATAFESNRKIVLLSHSSVENLTKHWVNTASLVPRVRCHPCHRLHHTWEHCRQDAETGAAACQRDIHPADVFAAIDVFHTKPADRVAA